MKKSILLSASVIAVSFSAIQTPVTYAYDEIIETETLVTIAPGQKKTAVSRCPVGTVAVGGFVNLNPLLAGDGNAVALGTGSLDIIRTNVNPANNRYSASLRLSNDAQGPVSGNVKISASCVLGGLLEEDLSTGRVYQSENSTSITVAPGQSETVVARCDNLLDEDSEGFEGFEGLVVGGTYNLNSLISGNGNSGALAQGSVDIARTNADGVNNRYSVTVRVSSDALMPVTGEVKVTALCVDFVEVAME